MWLPFSLLTIFLPHQTKKRITFCEHTRPSCVFHIFFLFCYIYIPPSHITSSSGTRALIHGAISVFDSPPLHFTSLFQKKATCFSLPFVVRREPLTAAINHGEKPPHTHSQSLNSLSLHTHAHTKSQQHQPNKHTTPPSRKRKTKPSDNGTNHNVKRRRRRREELHHKDTHVHSRTHVPS